MGFGYFFINISYTPIFCQLSIDLGIEMCLNHGLLESRTGNFNITVKKQKIDALISERIDEIG